MSYYHNVATAQGAGLNTSTDVGIPNANLDDYTSGLSRIVIGGHDGRLHGAGIGFSPSLPWDRSERTWNVAATVTKLVGNHTVKFGGEWRHNRDFLLQTQDAGGSRGEFQFNASGTGLAGRNRLDQQHQHRQLVCRVPARLAQRRAARPEGHRPGHAALGDVCLHPRQVADSTRASRSTSACGGSTTRRWSAWKASGGLSNYDPTTNTLNVAGYGATADKPGREEQVQQLLAPHRRVVAPGRARRSCVPATAPARIPFPDNRYAFNFPVKQNNSGSAANGFQRAGSMAAGFPGAGLREHPDQRRHSGHRHAAQRHVRLHPERAARGNAPLVERRLPAPAAMEPHGRGRLRRQPRRGHGDGRGHQREHRPGSGNVGRPQFAQFNRTGTTRKRTNDGKSEYNAMQIKVDRRFKNGILVSNWYTLGRGWDYVSENNSIATPMDFEQELGAVGLRSPAQLRAERHLRVALGSGQEVAERRHGRQDHRRMAVERAASGAVRPAAEHHRQRHAVQHARQHRVCQPQRVEHACSAISETASCTSTRLSMPCPPPGTQGNMSRNAGPEGPGFWELDMSLFKRFAVGGGSRFAEFRVDAFNVTNSPRWENPNTGFSTASGNTFGQVTSILGGTTSRSLRFRRTVRLLTLIAD